MKTEPTTMQASEATRTTEAIDRATDTVQRSVAPTLGLCTDVPLYFRANEFVSFDHRRQDWRLVRGCSLWFDTYFNGLSVRRWKRTAHLADLSVRIAFRGRLTVRLHVMASGAVSTVIDEIELASDDRAMQAWPIPAWAGLDDGIVFLSVHALDDATLESFAFTTSTPPRRAVRLGLCITHYDRRAQVVPAIARLKRQLLDDPAFSARVGLVVVDNSRNLAAAETAGATLVPNRNLGGAGGFARGMMHLNDEGSYTHALFMDDDASCEVEAIRRTVALLEHAVDPRTAISGAMLLAREPYRQFESGARFDGLCTPLRHGIDLRDPAVLAWNEREQLSDYGSWWFFAFPLKQAVGYPYPFFVRGDDIDFSLRNDFALVSANGVASWQESFAFKHAPQTSYLDTRNHLLHILHGYRGGRGLALYVTLRMFLIANLAGQYEVAKAAIMAIDDVRRGPTFFEEHADLAEPRRRLQALTRAERMRPLDLALLRGTVVPGPHERRRRSWLRFATANGHLLPRFFFTRRPARFDKGYLLPLRGTFRRRRTVVYDEVSGSGMVLSHSKRRFFANLFDYTRAALRLALEFGRLAKDYQAAYPYLTSDAYWREQFAATAPPVATTAGEPAPTATAQADGASPHDRVPEAVAHAA